MCTVYGLLSDAGVLHQESEEAEEGGTGTHLREALRQFRISHRGQYRHVLEEALSTICQLGDAAEESPAPGDEAPPPESAATPGPENAEGQLGSSPPENPNPPTV